MRSILGPTCSIFQKSNFFMPTFCMLNYHCTLWHFECSLKVATNRKWEISKQSPTANRIWVFQHLWCQFSTPNLKVCPKNLSSWCESLLELSLPIVRSELALETKSCEALLSRMLCVTLNREIQNITGCARQTNKPLLFFNFIYATYI